MDKYAQGAHSSHCGYGNSHCSYAMTDDDENNEMRRSGDVSEAPTPPPPSQSFALTLFLHFQSFRFGSLFHISFGSLVSCSLFLTRVIARRFHFHTFLCVFLSFSLSHSISLTLCSTPLYLVLIKPKHRMPPAGSGEVQSEWMAAKKWVKRNRPTIICLGHNLRVIE